MPLNLLLLSLLIPLALIPSIFGKDKAAQYEQDHTTWVYPPWEHTWGIVRATQTHLTFYSLGSAKFINPQGMAAVRLEATDDPTRRGDDDEVTVYGVNTGENSIIYNKSMTSLGFYSGQNIPDKPLQTPWDIAALPNGLLFITDSGNRRVVKLRNVNAELRYEATSGTDSPASLVLPRGVAVTGGGRVVVADAGSDRVVVLDTSGAFLWDIKGLDRPVGLAAVDEGSAHARPPSNYIVVSDSGGQRIRKYTLGGKLLHEVDVARVTGSKNPYIGHIETDLFHNIVATDSANCAILKFDNELNFLATWGEKGRGRSRFTGPTGIAIWRRFGQTFVAEQGGAHYLWIGADLSEPPQLSVEPGPVLRVRLGLTERSQVTLELVDADGDVVRNLETTRISGRQSINWLLNRARTPLTLDVEDPVNIGKLRPPPPGSYTLRIRLRATYSSRKAFERVFETRLRLGKEHYSG